MITIRNTPLKGYQRDFLTQADLILASLEVLSVIMALGIGIWLNIIIH